MNKALLQSAKTGGTDDWTTPPDLFAFLSTYYGPFELDPCTSKYGARLPTYFLRLNSLSLYWMKKKFISGHFVKSKLISKNAVAGCSISVKK